MVGRHKEATAKDLIKKDPVWRLVKFLLHIPPRAHFVPQGLAISKQGI